MKLASVNSSSKIGQQAFTLVELMVAASIGVILAGTVVLLLIQAAKEQLRGFSDMTVEERAYTLQANITSCLRGSSSGNGMQPVAASQVLNGATVIGYKSINIFKPNFDGTAFTVGNITANWDTGEVIYTPDISHPATTTLWMSNSPGVVLKKLYFATHLRLDGSQNNQLAYVNFRMNDNGTSPQNPANNVADIERSFSVQLRAE